MAETTTIRIGRETHTRVSRLAAERHETIDETVSRARCVGGAASVPNSAVKWSVGWFRDRR